MAQVGSDNELSTDVLGTLSPLSNSTKKKRRRLTSDEVKVLSEEFDRNPKPNAKLRNKLAVQIPGMNPRAVQIWFQNRRAKWKVKRMAEGTRNSKSFDASSPEQSSSSNPSPSPNSSSIGKKDFKKDPKKDIKRDPKTIKKEIKKEDFEKGTTEKREAKRPAIGAGIRRYASDGALHSLKKEEEENFQLSYSADIYDLQKSTSTPDLNEEAIDALEYLDTFDDFDALTSLEYDPYLPPMESLSLEQDGLEPLVTYAANLVLRNPLLVGGEEITPSLSGINEPTSIPRTLSAGRPRAIPPPPTTKPYIPKDLFVFKDQTQTQTQSQSQSQQRKTPDQLYPNLNANLMMLHNPESYALRKTRSAPHLAGIEIENSPINQNVSKKEFRTRKTQSQTQTQLQDPFQPQFLQQSQNPNPKSPSFENRSFNFSPSTPSSSLSPVFLPTSNTTSTSSQIPLQRFPSSGSERTSPRSLSPSSSHSSPALGSPFQRLDLNSPSHHPHSLPPRSFSSSSITPSNQNQSNLALYPRSHSTPNPPPGLSNLLPPRTSQTPTNSSIYQLSPLHEFFQEDLTFDETFS